MPLQVWRVLPLGAIATAIVFTRNRRLAEVLKAHLLPSPMPG